MAVEYMYSPPAEGTREVIVSFYLDNELVLKCPVPTVFSPGPYDAELTEQDVSYLRRRCEARLLGLD